uniref:(northern house mosquito) hypothetical protein n=1 Tax=Culex pipiens TaxID=7175 RepID=A0A8D8FFK7_CULPI
MASVVRASVPTTRRRWCFSARTAASHRPPNVGARAGMKWNWMVDSAQYADTFSRNCWSRNWLSSSFSSFSAPVKLVALSQYRLRGRPLRATNRLSAAMNPSVLRSLTSSMCVAFVAIHTNSAM